MSDDRREEIWMKGEFTIESANNLRKQIIKYSDEFSGADIPIIIYINSYGGSADALNNVLDTLDSVPHRIITVACGTAMSAGAILLSAGDERYVTKNSRIMIHQISAGTWGNIDDVKNSTEEISRLNTQVMDLLAKNCDKSVKQLNKLFKDKRDIYMSAEEAVKFGIADKIGCPRLIEEKSYNIVMFDK